jgi:hypothetical protein
MEKKGKQEPETEALIIRHGLILVVFPAGVPRHHKEDDGSISSFFFIVSVGGWLPCFEQDEKQEQVSSSNTGGGLEGTLVNYLPSKREYHETSPSTDFMLT